MEIDLETEINSWGDIEIQQWEERGTPRWILTVDPGGLVISGLDDHNDDYDERPVPAHWITDVPSYRED